MLGGNLTDSWIGVGFGTAALHDTHQVVTMALQEGFRRFDTAEAEYWYNQAEVGRALNDFFTASQEYDECVDEHGRFCGRTCSSEDLRISTKIPPWSLTSHYDIRRHAADSREELLGFCEHWIFNDGENSVEDGDILPYPLDVYFIHAPVCWKGWHSRCENPPETLDLKSAWLAMEAVVGHDRTARRIGLSNVHPADLREIIRWVRERQLLEKKRIRDDSQQDVTTTAPPRLPDAVQIYADPINPAEEIRKICDENGIEFVSYSTLGSQHRGGRNRVLQSLVVQELAAKYKRSTAEIVLQWARQHGMSVIPRSNNRKHIQELARCLSNEETREFQLDAPDMTRIDSMRNSQ